MFRHNRCYDKTMNMNEANFNSMPNGMNEYPSAMPMDSGMMMGTDV